MRSTFLFGALLLSSCASQSPKTAGPQEVAISVTDEGFVPATVAVKKGEPVTLVFTRKIENTCAVAAVFDSTVGKNVELPLNQAVRVDLAGIQDSVTYACPMGMFGGTIVAK